MPILVLARGGRNTGKTTTIKRVVLEKIGVSMEEKRGDIHLALPAYWKGGERRDARIGLASGGDTEWAVSYNVEFFEKNLPEVMIMACRALTNVASTYMAVEAFVSKHQIRLDTVWFENRGDEDEEAYFVRKADEILSKIP